MKEILIAVKNKISMNLGNATYVCDNSDYRIVFDFDEEWEEHPVKTARFKYNGMYQEVVFTGSVCDMPVIRDARLISIGVYAGNLQTSTPAVVHASQSILSGDPAHEKPEEDVYNQLVQLVESGVLKGPDGKSAYELAVENGYIGSEIDWLASLHGAPGKTPEYGVDYGTPEQITGIAQQAAGILADDFKEISDGKVDKVEGMGLSSNDYDNTAKAKVEAIPEGPKYTDTVYDDTEVKQSLNQLKDDLSDKLQKSPANWEPWTAEEQAAARTRMGIQEPILIDQIELSDAVSSVERSVCADGTPYNLRAIYIYITLGDCTQYENRGSFTARIGNKMYIRSNVDDIAKTTAAQSALIYLSMYRKNDSWIGEFDYHVFAQYPSSKHYFYTKFEENPDSIERIILLFKSGFQFPAGSVIKIYGVRA